MLLAGSDSVVFSIFRRGQYSAANGHSTNYRTARQKLGLSLLVAWGLAHIIISDRHIQVPNGTMVSRHSTFMNQWTAFIVEWNLWYDIQIWTTFTFGKFCLLLNYLKVTAQKVTSKHVNSTNWDRYSLRLITT